jgi:RNA polymerase sigma factor (sigma-70 family)
MDEDAPISELVSAAESGDERAWEALVARFSPLLAAVIGGYRLPTAARQDVAQIVWLKLVENLGSLRDARALPKWLVTTARREALHQIEQQRRSSARDPLDPQWEAATAAVVARPDGAPDEAMLQRERHEALLAALAELPGHQRELLLLLIADPPLSYTVIADQLGIPVGNIGPTRCRALDRLRRSASLRALSDGPLETAKGWGA